MVKNLALQKYSRLDQVPLRIYIDRFRSIDRLIASRKDRLIDRRIYGQEPRLPKVLAAGPGAYTHTYIHVEYAERKNAYRIQFIFSLLWAAGRRLRRPLGSRRRSRPQASRYIPGSSP